MLKNPQLMLISSYKLENGKIITPLLNFYPSLGLQSTKTYRIVEYTHRKRHIGNRKFVQSVVDDE